MKRSGGPVGRPSMNKKIEYPEFAERLQGLMDKRGMTRRDMVRSIGCTDAVFGNYYNGCRLPPGKYADKIADLLGITVGCLIYGKREEEPKIIEVTKSPLDPNELATLRQLLDKLQQG